MAKQEDIRASGKTPADEVAKQETRELDVPTEEEKRESHDGLGINLNGGPATRPEDKGISLTPAFSRMRTDWNGPDRQVLVDMRKGVETIMGKLFHDVYAIMYSIDRIVRLPIMDPVTGEIKTDEHGLTVWSVDPDTGMFREDWTRVGYKEREELIYRISTGMFRWTAKQADLNAEALFARAQFEEGFANAFREPETDRPTIDDRTAHARSRAAELRYFAVYTSYVSKRADAVVRAVELLGQRLKDLSQ